MKYELVISLDELEDDEAVAVANGLSRGLDSKITVVEVNEQSRRTVAIIGSA